MSRKERKYAAAQRKDLLQIAWCDQLKEAMDAGMSWRQACLSVDEAASRLVKKEPQRKAEIVGAWAELFSTLTAEFREANSK